MLSGILCFPWPPPHCSDFASDTSKDNLKMPIMAIDIHTKILVVDLVPHSNMVFKAVTLAIHLALTSILITHSHILILTDSLYTLHAIEA